MNLRNTRGSWRIRRNRSQSRIWQCWLLYKLLSY